MTNLDSAIEFWFAQGWKLETRTHSVAIMFYDDRGWWATANDKRRSKLGRISLSMNDAGQVRSRLLSKFTTDMLHALRYAKAKREFDAQA